jgi:AraC-like DNA-binding protein
MNANTACRASAWVGNRRRGRSSHSSVAKKLSHMALSYASPTEPIEGRTPASRQRRPNSIDVYWLDSNGRRNTLTGRVAMTRRRLRSDRSGRASLFSPGRPVVAGRVEQRRFWAAIAAGMASEDAAVQAGMSQAVGTRLFRKTGGMPPAMFRPSAKPLSGRYLSFAEREEIALLRVQGCSMREVARRLGRAASTISRELRATLRPEAAA